jgi:multiple sugar transport system permease protein
LTIAAHAAIVEPTVIRHRSDTLTAWALLSPALLVLGVFGIFPIGYAFYVSLHRWRIKKESVVGFGHYAKALGEPVWLLCLVAGLALLLLSRQLRSRATSAGTRATFLALLAVGGLVAVRGFIGMYETGDLRLFNAFKVTLFYAMGTIPCEVAGALVLAYLLFRILTARGFFRILYFLPYITPMIATAVVFRTIFSPNPGSLANRFWSIFGSSNQRWLQESRTVPALLLQGMGIDVYPEWIDTVFPSLALLCVILYNIWVYIGYDTVILLAGLSAIPRHYFEAAAIDGASQWQQFRHVTLPLISPTLFFITLVAVIGTFKAFNHIYIMRTAGAQDSVDVASVLIFDQIYQYHTAGYASALALILFVAILMLTVVQNRLLGRRVFYGD